MSRHASRIRIAGLLFGVFVSMIGPSCKTEAPEKPPSLLPDRAEARRALEASLEEWRTSPQTDTTTPGRSILFVDRERRPGQKLRTFTILGDTEVDNRRRFVTRLSLAEPDETILAAYYVFGGEPMWVYRAEEFDMMMNMDMEPDERATPADSAEPENPPAADAGNRAADRSSPKRPDRD